MWRTDTAAPAANTIILGILCSHAMMLLLLRPPAAAHAVSAVIFAAVFAPAPIHPICPRTSWARSGGGQPPAESCRRTAGRP